MGAARTSWSTLRRRRRWRSTPGSTEVDTLLEAASARGARIAWVVDTHTHADHLTGAHVLAEKSGATHLAHPKTKTTRKVTRIDVAHPLPFGGDAIRFIESQGHTPDSVSIVVGGHVFTGDALFVGGAGRVDFPGGSASELFDTFRRLESLPSDTAVMPGHVYGTAPTSTLAAEKTGNPLFAESDRANLTRRLSGSAEPPANMMAILRYNMGQTSEPAPIAVGDVARTTSGRRDVVLLDVRTPIEFAGDRVADSVNIPLDALKERAGELPAGAEVVVICQSGNRATMAAPILAAAGHEVRVMEGGMRAWTTASLPVIKGRKVVSLDRQVQITVGVLALAGSLLTVFVDPAFIAVPMFLGAGLLFAGLSGFCGMALVLGKMPWNQVAATSAGAACATTGSSSACAAPTTSACAAPTSSACAAPTSPSCAAPTRKTD
jgi:glyoxylase-like metal-dependent hydrolase (beta-lactamase superfamily II)/rhodanese-related sulfurtransferase